MANGRALELLIRAGHPDDAGLIEHLPVPAPFVFAPKFEGANHQVDVRPVAIGGADDARFAARAGARIAGSPGIQKRHTGAESLQVNSGPASERARADNRDVLLATRCH